MFWRVKSLHFKILSLLPGGTTFYNFTQEQVTGSTAATLNRVSQKVDVGLRYWDWLQANGRTSKITDGSLLDYGAGWHPTIPLLWSAFGNKNQLLVDICENMDVRKISDTGKYLSEIVSKSDWREKESIRSSPIQINNAARSCNEALSPLGIRYEAPFSSRQIGSMAGRFDAVFCTQVLQHVHEKDQPSLFQQFHNSLKPGGLMLGMVHLVGQFRSPHLSQGMYQHLIPSPWMWDTFINSSLMSFNRLKAGHYQHMLDVAGFRTLEFTVEPPTAEDLNELSRTAVHASFKHLSPEALAARSVFFVAEKK
jgi:SAM-dependent methyltransferase